MTGDVALETIARPAAARRPQAGVLEALPVIGAFVLVALFIGLPLASVVFGRYYARFADMPGILSC